VLAARKVETLVPASTTVALPADLKKKTFSMWASMPYEIKIHVLSFLLPRELVQASRVSHEFHALCFDGQLWSILDASEFYRDIPAESLAKIVVAAGPFVRDLNLRGCVQVEHYKRAEVIVKACTNLVNATLEGCQNIQRSTLHSLLIGNEQLTHLNLTGLAAVTNVTCKTIARVCPQLEMLNISWCKEMNARGVKTIVEGCHKLKDLRAGQVKGFGDRSTAEAIFETNNLERLVLSGCTELGDAALQIMMQGTDPEIDILTTRPIVPPRKLHHLDLSGCTRLSSRGVKSLGYVLPDLQGLQLTGISGLTDAALEPILASTPRLTHLDVEDITGLTNAFLSQHLAKAPCAPTLEHLSVSNCENIGDSGMLPVIRNCRRLKTVLMDNTRISDLVLAEAASMVRERCAERFKDGGAVATSGKGTTHNPVIGLTLDVYDCPNVTWTGIREVLNRNAEITTTKTRVVDPAATATVETSDPQSTSSCSQQLSATSPTAGTRATCQREIIALKCYYGWQMTVGEHTKRVLRGDLASANRLERKWADFMQATEEAGIEGAHGRRRRRRAREAQQAHADEEEGGASSPAPGGRRRARTAACVVM